MTGHDPDEVRAVRREELARSCAILGIEHVEAPRVPGLRDGRVGHRERPRRRSATSTSTEARARLDRPGRAAPPRRRRHLRRARRVRAPRPRHGPPRGRRVSTEAHRASRQRLYFSAVPRSAIEAGQRRRWRAMRESGADISEDDLPDPEVMGTDDELITTVVDVSEHVAQKRDGAAGARQPVRRRVPARPTRRDGPCGVRQRVLRPGAPAEWERRRA